MSHRFVLVLGCLLTLLPGQPATGQSEPAVERMSGERLEAALLGPSFVESMQAAVEREASLPPGPKLNPKARNGAQGVWAVPTETSTFFPHSGSRYITNKWGDTRMGIAFPRPVDLQGAWFAGQGGGPGVWTNGIRAHGYRNGKLILVTDWFTDIDDTPSWFAMDLDGIDRVEIEAAPVFEGSGWYALDDLTFTWRDSREAVTLDFEDLPFRRKVTGTNYAGLIWETGTGDFLQKSIDGLEGGVHHPITEDLPEVEPPLEATTDVTVRGGGTPPDLLMDFQGALRGDAGSFSFPPDTCGAIGPDHYVITVNRNFQVFNKSNGARLVNITLGSFLPGSNGDPRVIFDFDSQRWIVIVSDFDDRLYLAVSASDDPMGSWFKTSFVVSTGSDTGCFPDYPTLGVDEVGIYTTALMAGCGRSLFVIEKAPLIAPSQNLGVITAFRGLPGGTMQPCVTIDGVGTNQYIVAQKDNANLLIRRVDGPITSPSLALLADVPVPAHSSPPLVPSMGSSTGLNSVDARLMNSVFINNRIWTAHSINVGGRAACRWYEINPFLTTVEQFGTISDPNLHYFFPGLCANARGDMVIGFSGSSENQFAAAYFTGRRFDDPAGMTADPILLRQGDAPQNNIDSFGRNRWGDYSLTTLDPDDMHTFWTIQEYAHATDIWGTWVAKVQYDLDCNDNGTPDADEIAMGLAEDCNDNGIPDDCDLLSGVLVDSNGNMIPDACEAPGTFTMVNPADGAVEVVTAPILTWASAPNATTYAVTVDDNADFSSPEFSAPFVATTLIQAFPPLDEGTTYFWKVVAGNPFGSTPAVPATFSFTTITPFVDCNDNGVNDIDDIAMGTSQDCNANDIPDECDIASGTSEDLDLNGIPDSCESACPGDVNGDNAVDVLDLNLVIGNFGSTGAPGLPGDANDDGAVNVNDLNLVIGNFGVSCP